MTDATEKKRDQRHIQSIDVGFKVVRALQHVGSNATLKAIAEAAGMPPAKAHLYMVSLMRQKLVTQDPSTQRYSLGPYAVELGLAAIRQMDLVEVAREPMQALQDQLRLPVFMSVWGTFGPTIVFRLDRNTVLPVVMKIGHVLPLLSSATGNLFLSYFPDIEVAPMIERETTGAGAEDRIREIRASVRRHGMATSEGQLNKGFAAIACGIFDHEHNLIASLTTLGFSVHVDMDPTGQMANMVRAAAGDISKALGNPEN